MPIVFREWSAPQSLIASLASGQRVEEGVGETKTSFAHFLIESGISPPVAAEAADALMGRIVAALARGETPEHAVASATQDLEKALGQMVGAEAGHSDPVTAALAQGGSEAAAVIARVAAEAGNSPEAQAAAAHAWQSALAQGRDPAAALKLASEAGHAATSLAGTESVPLSPEGALAIQLALGGPALTSALAANTAGMSPEQAASFTKGFFDALTAGATTGTALSAGAGSAAAEAATAAAQQVPQSRADALVAALAGNGDPAQALAAAGLAGDPLAAQALAHALAGGAASGMATAAAQQTSGAEATAEAAASAGGDSSLLAALATGGPDAAGAVAAAGGGHDGAAFASALAEALAAGAQPDAALAAASGAAESAQSQQSAGALPPSADSALASALASGEAVDAALAAAGLPVTGDAGEAFTAALVQALAAGSDPAAAEAAATVAAVAAEQQAEQSQQGVPPPDPGLAAMASGEAAPSGGETATGPASNDNPAGTQTAEAAPSAATGSAPNPEAAPTPQGSSPEAAAAGPGAEAAGGNPESMAAMLDPQGGFLQSFAPEAGTAGAASAPGSESPEAGSQASPAEAAAAQASAAQAAAAQASAAQASAAQAAAQQGVEPASAATTIPAYQNAGEETSHSSSGTTNSTPTPTVVQPPVLANAGTGSYTEGGNPGSVAPGITVSDVGAMTLASATVAITKGFFTGDTLTADTAGTAIAASYDAGSGVLTLSGSDSLANYQGVLQSVVFSSTSLNPTDYGASTNRTVSIHASNTEAANQTSNVLDSTVAVIGVNQPPVLADAGSGHYAEGGNGVTVDSSATLSDPDTLTQVSATATITSGFLTGDVLAASTAGTAIGASYNAGTGVLTLSGTDTVANYQSVLRSITYTSTSTNPTHYQTDTSRTIAFQSDDGQSGNNTSNLLSSAVAVTAVNQPPVLSGGESAHYTQGGATATVADSVSLSDPDTLTQASATATITSGLFPGDTLTADTAGTAISASYSAGTGVLTLSGADTVADYQSVLRSISYSSTSLNPTDYQTDTSRTIAFQSDDGQGLNETSNVVTSTVSVTGVNQPPVLTGGGSASYTEGGAAVTVADGLGLADPDTLTQVSATATITSGFFAGDVLAANTAGTGIGANYNTATGVLTLSGTDTVANYQSVLQSITYASTSTNPTDFHTDASRTIAFQSDDGQNVSDTSNIVTSTVSVIAVDQPPALADGGHATYTYGNGPVTLNGNITVSDTDSLTLSSAAAAFASGFFTGDTLAVNTAGTAITASYNAATGVLSLSGTDTVADYQSVLQSLTYASSSNNPTNSDTDTSRTITLQVDNGQSADHASNVLTSTVAVSNGTPASYTSDGAHFTANASGVGNGDIEIENAGLTAQQVLAGDDFTTSTLTLETWIYVPNNAQYGSFIGLLSDMNYTPDLPGDGFKFTLNDGKLDLQVAKAGSVEEFEATSQLTPGSWHNVAAIYNGNGTYGSASIYVDGSLQGTSELPLEFDRVNFTGAVTLGDTLTIGNDDDPTYTTRTFNGMMANVALWNTDRSSEVALDASHTISDSPAGLAGYWPLDDNANDTINGNNGFVVGGSVPSVPLSPKPLTSTTADGATTYQGLILASAPAADQLSYGASYGSSHATSISQPLAHGNIYSYVAPTTTHGTDSFHAIVTNDTTHSSTVYTVPVSLA